MNGLLIIAPPSLATGYRLAGADVYDAATPAEVARLLQRWLAERRQGLVAVEEGLFAGIKPDLLGALAAYRLLPLLPLPSGEPLPDASRSRTRIADLVREAVGYHITFAGDR